MKHLLVLISLMFVFLAFFFSVNMYLTVKDLEHEVTVLHSIQKNQIENLEKEIRLLKTDIDILQYGYKEEK